MDLNALLNTLCWTQVLQGRFSHLCFIISSFSYNLSFPLPHLVVPPSPFCSSCPDSELCPGRVQHPLFIPWVFVTSPHNLILLVTNSSWPKGFTCSPKFLSFNSPLTFSNPAFTDFTPLKHKATNYPVLSRVFCVLQSSSQLKQGGPFKAGESAFHTKD